MEATPCLMAYRVEIGRKASAQLSELDSTVALALERKIICLSQNAADMIHRRLVGMPDDLADFTSRSESSESTESSIDPKCIGMSETPHCEHGDLVTAHRGVLVFL